MTTRENHGSYFDANQAADFYNTVYYQVTNYF